MEESYILTIQKTEKKELVMAIRLYWKKIRQLISKTGCKGFSWPSFCFEDFLFWGISNMTPPLIHCFHISSGNSVIWVPHQVYLSISGNNICETWCTVIWVWLLILGKLFQIIKLLSVTVSSYKKWLAKLWEFNYIPLMQEKYICHRTVTR